MNASVPSGALPLHITIGLGEVYTVPLGTSRTFSYPNTAWVCFSSTQDGGGSIRYNASSTTNLQMRYFAYIPEEIRQFYQVSLNRSLDYLSFVEQWLEAYVLAPWDDFSGTWHWNLNLSLQSTGCHQFSAGCRDVSVDLTRNISGVGDAYLWAPRDARGNLIAARAVRQGRLNFSFNHDQQSGEQTVAVQNRYGSAAATAGLISDNYPLGASTLETYVNYNTGLIMIDKLRFLQSIDPLGFPELGENEFVFKEQSGQVRLEIPFGCRVIYNPPAFLLFHPFWDALRWYAQRMQGNTSFSFTHAAEAVWGYANLTNELFIAFRAPGSTGLLYQANSLPEWDQFGRHTVSLRFVPISFSDNFSPFDMGRAEFEIFFPATGTCHPSTLTDPYTGQRVPNWFYYYWRVVGRPNDVFFTAHNPYGPEANPDGYYDSATNRIFIRNKAENYTEESLLLFQMGVNECNHQLMPMIVYADRLRVLGIHAFLQTLYHERGHQWTYTTYFRSCQIPNAFFTIAGLRGRSRDQDGDSLDDEWEALNKLCPYAKDTTGLFSNHPVYRALGGDAEVVAEIYAYTHLLQVQNIWRHDWSDKGLQKGNPLERFLSFPWTYDSTGRNTPANSNLLKLTDLPRPYGCQ
jgi:hypothetical protein